VSTDASDWAEALAGDGRAFARVFRLLQAHLTPESCHLW
jgi:hypothetical protein